MGVFLVVPTVSNPQETKCDLRLNHLSLLTSAEAMDCVGEDEEFNLDTLRVINNMISASSIVNNEILDASVDNTSSQALQQSTTSRKGRNSRSKKMHRKFCKLLLTLNSFNLLSQFSQFSSRYVTCHTLYA